MKILTIFEDGRIGGPHKQFFYFFKTLSKKNQDKHFLIMPGLKKKIKFNKELNLLRLNLVYLSYLNIFSYIATFIFDIIKIIRIISINKIEKVYIAGGSGCLKSVLASVISRTNFIWHIHDSNTNKILFFYFNFFKFFAEKIIFVSKKSKNFYLKKNFLNYVILPSAVDLKYFDKKCFNKKINKTIITIANINPDKNILMLLDLINFVQKKNKDIQFKLVGRVWDSQRGYFENIKKTIKEKKLKNLRFIRNANSIESFLKKSDLLLVTSKNESMPLSICEAMASSKPIISTDVGDIKNFVEFSDKKNLLAGKVFKQQDHESMGNYILKLYDDRKKLKFLAKNSKKISHKFFDIIQYKKKLYSLLNVQS